MASMHRLSVLPVELHVEVHVARRFRRQRGVVDRVPIRRSRVVAAWAAARTNRVLGVIKRRILLVEQVMDFPLEGEVLVRPLRCIR